jgi:nucleotide-binding universal stress UspA family protein
MSAPRQVLVALAGTEDSTFAQQVGAVVGTSDPGLHVTLLHVEETGPRELAAHDPLLRRGPWPHSAAQKIDLRLAAADAEAAAELLKIWHERFASVFPAVEIGHLVANGRAELEIVAAATRTNADVLAIGARPRSGPTEASPRSVGHVARFVLDHAPVPVVLIRRAG